MATDADGKIMRTLASFKVGKAFWHGGFLGGLRNCLKNADVAENCTGRARSEKLGEVNLSRLPWKKAKLH